MGWPWLDDGPGRVPGGAVLDGAEDPLHVQPVLERRGRLPLLRDRGYQVDDLVGEAVLVAETVPGRPPGTHVRVLGLGDQDPPEALLLDRLRAVEELKQVVLLEVEGERAVGA